MIIVNWERMVIYLKDVWVSFSSNNTNVNILKGINLKVNEGEFITITGPTGSGKTTLLYTIAGIISPIKGDVYIYTMKLNTMSEEAKAYFRAEYMGFVFQDYNLISSFTVFENILFPMELLDEPPDLDFAKSLIKKFGLNGKENLLPYQLSGGEKQRVAFARALANNPPILLVDEPTSNLDEENKKRIKEILTELKNEGRTIILVSHDRELWSLSDRLYKLENGRLVECSLG